MGRLLGGNLCERLYSASLFDYGPAARSFLGEAVELGRSFVQPRYWGSRSLDYLWQGIGAYLRERPQLRYLMGPVSLSARLPEAARDWIVETHRHFFGDREHWARARTPYRAQPDRVASITSALLGLDLRQGLARLRQELDSLGCSLPVLYRQYVELCEPEGVRFLDFGLDPDFGHCVDGLIRVDLGCLKPAKRARYLGAQAE